VDVDADADVLRGSASATTVAGDLAGGSGLIGVKDRVEALGGLVWVQSAPDAGTTARAELPLGPAT